MGGVFFFFAAREVCVCILSCRLVLCVVWVLFMECARISADGSSERSVYYVVQTRAVAACSLGNVEVVNQETVAKTQKTTACRLPRPLSTWPQEQR